MFNASFAQPWGTQTTSAATCWANFVTVGLNPGCTAYFNHNSQLQEYGFSAGTWTPSYLSTIAGTVPVGALLTAANTFDCYPGNTSGNIYVFFTSDAYTVRYYYRSAGGSWMLSTDQIVNWFPITSLASSCWMNDQSQSFLSFSASSTPDLTLGLASSHGQPVYGGHI